LIRIPQRVEILEEFGFSKSGAEMITFESGSALNKIEGFCFYESSLKNICIPSEVDFILKFAFTGNVPELVEVCEANVQLMITEHTRVDQRDAIVVRYFEADRAAVVSKHVRVIGHDCFSRMTFERLSFAPNSELTLLEERCFELFSLQSLIIPSSVEAIEASTYRRASIKTLRFESALCLRQIESECFAECSLGTIQLPVGLQALPNSCFMAVDIE
jgi:hypothetical protein